jgi:hypothetical protein
MHNGSVARVDGDHVRVSPDRTKMIFRESDGTCAFYTLTPFARTRVLPFETCKLGFLPGGKRVVVLGADGDTIEIRDLDGKTKTLRVPVPGETTSTNRADGGVLATWTKEGDLRLVRTSDGASIDLATLVKDGTRLGFVHTDDGRWQGDPHAVGCVGGADPAKRSTTLTRDF